MMVTIDPKKCVGCGLCEKICHHKCIEVTKKENEFVIQIDHELCSTCSQCIAICPQRAIMWNAQPPLRFERKNLPTPSQVEELLKERRTVRNFKGRRIDRAVLEEIAAMGGYAPTNDFHLKCLICDDPNIITDLDNITLKRLTIYHTLVFDKRFTFNIFKFLSPNVNRIMKEKIQRSIDLGTTFESPPAAIIFVIGNRKTLLSAESAQFAVYNMILYAQTIGLGSRYLASGAVVFNKNTRARRILGLSADEMIWGALELGVPLIRFSNKVAGKELPITFTGEVEG